MRWVAAACAALYFVALVAITLSLRFVGERWWGTDVGLYVPRVVFLAPLPITAGALLAFGPRRLLYAELVAFFFVLFSLMGFVVSFPPSTAKPSIRVLSINVNSVYAGVQTVVDAIHAYSPDIVLMQEVLANQEALQKSLSTFYSTVSGSTQFAVATRFPITATLEPERLPLFDRLRSPRFLRYTMQTPLGEVAVYNVHPISPRYGLYSLRGRGGLRQELRSGSFFKAEHVGAMQADSALRATQVTAFAKMASAEPGPVILGGDTNLPTLSPVLADGLGAFVDGFPSAGFGFGYTFPAKHPWMRIDRILTNHDLEFSTFKVGCEGASDHLCVVADIQRK
ncbi:MAG TPA: endonuclease/exonuclease/phosphatase family protein [Polyangiaceae bacterium]|nr:endonuclease/exonuclease/phosphatase family protein [Polyangiaceae bacterium]